MEYLPNISIYLQAVFEAEAHLVSVQILRE
jgi:hypothetical protein